MPVSAESITVIARSEDLQFGPRTKPCPPHVIIVASIILSYD